MWGIMAGFIYAPRRVECPEHGVVVEHIPWTPELLTYYLRFLRITGPFAKSEARGVGTQTCPLFCE